MQIIPAIDIKDGHCVRLKQGDLQSATVFSEDPAAMARNCAYEAQLRENFGAVGWQLTAEQVAKLDAASAVTPIYPYWHQRGFKERNLFPTS